MRKQSKPKGHKHATSHQQTMSRHFLRNRAQVCIAVASEDKCLNEKSSTFASFLLAFIVKQNVIWYGIPLQLGSAVLAASPSNLLTTPSLLALGWGIGETALMLCGCCSAAVNTWLHHVFILLATSAKDSTIWASMAKVNSIPARPTTWVSWLH